MKKIKGSIEAWEAGELGLSDSHVQTTSEDHAAQIDDAIQMQAISIRLQTTLIEDFKMLAEYHGIGYQPLMRKVLTRFAECEQKLLLKQFMAEAKRSSESKDPQFAESSAQAAG